MSNILVKVTGDGADAKATIDDVDASVDKFGKKVATAQIRVDAEQAKRDMAEVIAEARAIPSEETIRIRVAGDQAKLQQLQQRASGLEQALKNAAESGDSTDRITQQLGNVYRQIDATRGRIEQLGHDFDNLGEKGTGALTKITSAFTRGRTALDGFVEHIPLIGGLANKLSGLVSTGLSQLVTMLPTAAQGFAGMVAAGLSLAAVVPIVLALAAALAALVISLAQALIGIAALGVAFLAALGPIALIVGVVVDKLKNAYTAQTNLTAAVTAQKQAVIALQQAQQNESNERISALQAEKAATLALRQANEGLADAKTAHTEAQEALTDAIIARQQFLQQLAGFGMSPSDLTAASSNVSVSGNFGQTQVGSSQTATEQLLNQWKEINTAVTAAKEQVNDTATNTQVAANAAKNAKTTFDQFQKEGLKAYGPYAQALSTVKTDLQAVVNANHNLNVDSKKMAATDGILGVFDKLKRTLGAILGPATTGAFKGLGQAFEILAKGLKPLEPVLTTLGKSVGAGFVQLAKAVTSKTAISDLKQLITESAKLVPTLIGFFAGLGGVLIGVANAAMPHLKNGLEELGKKFIEVAKHPKAIKEFIDECVASTKTWFHDIGTLVSWVKTLAGFLKTLAPLAQAAAWPFIQISKAVSLLSSTEAANEAAGAQGHTALQMSAQQILNDERLLAGGSYKGASGQIVKLGGDLTRAFVTKQIANLRGQVGSIVANTPGGSEDQSWVQEISSGDWLSGSSESKTQARALKGLSPAQIAALQGKTIHNHFGSGPPTDPHHFSAVMTRQLRAKGAGIKAN